MPVIEQQISIMIIDDERSIRKTISHYLGKYDYKVRMFEDGLSCLEEFKKKPADILITDVCMPGFDGIELLKSIKEINPSTEVIMITAHGGKQIAIDALRAGAFDFLEKPVELSDLGETIKRTVRYQSALRERDILEKQMSELTSREASHWGIDNMIGKTKAMREILKDIRRVQNVPKTSVLITGESGTGKELVARAIHYGSPRRSAEFVAINCSAVPENLAESILFGHRKGSFTGASLDKIGCFEQADGGTLFLDEIGDMPATMQTKLLRVLEEHSVTPLGGSKNVNVDVRIIAATNRDLNNRIKKKEFRSDLYYRLASFIISIPALNDRKADIPHLVKYFTKKLSSDMGLAEPTITAEAITMLKEHTYPGNIRELRNIIERALIESPSGIIRPEHLHFCSILKDDAEPSKDISCDLPLNIDDTTTMLIRRAMAQTNGNVSEAAKLLGINRTKLHRNLYRLNDSE